MSVRELSIFFTFFVMLQFWNLFNARCLGSNNSAFSNLGGNRSFLMIAAIILLLQIVIVQFGGEFFRTEPLTFKEWIMIIASTSLVLIAGEILRGIRRLNARAK